jgi:hypothetical protein
LKKDLKMKFEKEKKQKQKKRPGHPSAQAAQLTPAPAHCFPPFPFLFPAALTTGPRLSAPSPPLPFFFFTALASRSGAAAGILPRPVTSLPSLLAKPAN